MKTIGYFITCDDALCEECFFKGTDGTYTDAVSRWDKAGGFEDWSEPIEIDEDTERDTPTHCKECEVVIAHDLTSDGDRYVRDAVEQCFREGKRSEVVEQWLHAYADYLDDDHEIGGGNEVKTGTMIDLFMLLPLREQAPDPLALAAEVAVELARLEAASSGWTGAAPPPLGWRNRAIETVAARHQMNPYELDRIVRGEG